MSEEIGLDDPIVETVEEVGPDQVIDPVLPSPMIYSDFRPNMPTIESA